MLQQIGAKTYSTIQFSEQSPEIFMPFNSLEIIQQREIVTPKTLLNGRNANRPIRDSIDNIGQSYLPVDTSSFCYYLYALLGDFQNITTKDDTTNRYLFYMAEDIPEFTLRKYYSDLKRVESFNECTVDDLDIVFGGDETELLTLSNLRAVTASTSVFSQIPSIYCAECKTLNPQLFTASINGVIFNSVYIGEILFSNNVLYQEYPVGKRNEAINVSLGVVQCGGYFVVLFDNIDQYLDIMSQHTVSIEIELRRDNKKDSEYVKFIFPEAIVKINSPLIQNQEGLVLDLEWVAFYEKGDIESTMLVEVKTDEKFVITKGES